MFDKNDKVGLIVGLVTGLTAILVVLFLVGYALNIWCYKRLEARGGGRRKKKLEPPSPYEAIGHAARASALAAKEEFMQRCVEGGVVPSDKEMQEVYWTKYEEYMKGANALSSNQTPGTTSPA